MRFGILVSAAALATAQLAMGAGYERTVTWSGKQTGVAGSGAATVHDSEAIFFNPAGLANIDTLEVSGNFSPTWVQSKGPVTGANTSLTSDTSFLPVVGITAGYKLCEHLGLGVGAYVAGGARAAFNGLDFSAANFTLKPNLISDVSMVEYSVGLGYRITPGLKVGASWRILHVGGNVESFVPTYAGSTLAALAAVRYNNLSATQYNGFRFGAQYDGDNWGAGAVVRTAVSFTANADLSGTLQTAGSTTQTSLTGTNGTLTNSFPVEGTLGAYYDLMNKTLRVIGEYAYANYSANTQLGLTGTLTGGPAPVDLSNSPLPQHWKDLHMGRLGFEYRGLEKTMLRAGYAIASDVTPKGYARATFSSPGLGHTITLGAGHSFLEDHLDFDGALEYSFASGSVGAGDVPTGVTTTLPGDYSTHAYGLHLGATYRF